MSITAKLQEAAQRKAQEQLAAQKQNLATGMASTSNQIVQAGSTEGSDASKSQEQEQPVEEKQKPAGGYEACAIKSLMAENKRFYPVDGYFFPENEAQKAECDRWVALGLICAPIAEANSQ